MQLVNTRLMRHPLNWLTVWSMVFVAAYVGHLIVAFANGRHPADPNAASPNSKENVAGPGTDIPV